MKQQERLMAEKGKSEPVKPQPPPPPAKQPTVEEAVQFFVQDRLLAEQINLREGRTAEKGRYLLKDHPKKRKRKE